MKRAHAFLAGWAAVYQLTGVATSAAFAPRSSPTSSRRGFSAVASFASRSEEAEPETTMTSSASTISQRRRAFFGSVAATSIAALSSGLVVPEPASALVKGIAPPPPKEKKEKKCVNVEECQEMVSVFRPRFDGSGPLKIWDWGGGGRGRGELGLIRANAPPPLLRALSHTFVRGRSQSEQAYRRDDEQDEQAKASAVPAKTAPGGSKYRETEEATDESSPVAKTGDAVSVYYKVLKLGKRSYDGLSGEATVVFSCGYGLEDGEKIPGDSSFRFNIGDATVIASLNDAVPGMRVGSSRRIAILPQMGWRKQGRECDGGPGGSGTGGDLKTDYVVVPTATMVAEEACFDMNKKPFPTAYAQQRRMAQRFDQSLIVEVKLARIEK